jgi:protein Tex
MTEADFIIKVAKTLSLGISQTRAVIQLFNEGATVPFIARYRKEQTDSLDEVGIINIRDEYQRLQALESRRAFILESIEKQGKLTDELKESIAKAETITELEDIYLPYKPKRKTRATVAKEKGLEPLAEKIYAQQDFDVDAEANLYIDLEKGVADVAEALQGAKDIIAERISENASVREALRNLFRERAYVTSRVVKSKQEEAQKYRDYFDWSEPLMKCPSHRMLAMRRGEKEDFLFLDIAPDFDQALDLIDDMIITAEKDNRTSILMEDTVEDAYKRLLQPSLEAEFRVMTKHEADLKAIEVFAENVRELLLAAPLGQKAILALDPGFRSGCKVVALGKEGQLIEQTVIYPHEPQRHVAASEAVIMDMIQKHNVEAIAIGNGTAGRETESFIRAIKVLPKEITIVSVNESGASIYSASDVAREEFPHEDITVRGAVSIGRRLADPLAELVKIDPKSIGVGQYQHDVDQYLLKDKLDTVVMSCVNGVGVELNTASKQLLSYVSGIGDGLAQNIIEYRRANGPFKSRIELKKVTRLGEKAFEQAAGFLRIRNSKNPLDQSAVHPEAYHIVEKMAKDLSVQVEDLMKDKNLRKQIALQNYTTDTIGLPTLKDIMDELEKPGRDPRKVFETFAFQEGVNKIEDLIEGMKLPGIITNVTKFGAFVDIGVHQDGLVHISQLADQFVDDPAKVVKVGQRVNVTVTEVEISRKRIALSMKSTATASNISNERSKVFTSRDTDLPKRPRVEASQNNGSMQDALAALKNKFNK